MVEGFSFYEEQSPGLGTYFLDTLFSDIDSLALYGGIHPIIHGFHRALSKRFPFLCSYLSRAFEHEPEHEHDYESYASASERIPGASVMRKSCVRRIIGLPEVNRDAPVAQPDRATDF